MFQDYEMPLWTKVHFEVLYYVPIYTRVACPIHWYFILSIVHSTSHGWMGEGNIAVMFVNMNRKKWRIDS